MYSFIVNPHAGGGKGARTWRKLEKRLKRLKTEYEVYLTEARGDAGEFAVKLLEEPAEGRVIVIVGGDGTVNEVINRISLDSVVTFGYIPTGTGNDLARSLHLPANPKKCLKKILNPTYYRRLDYGVLCYGEQMIHKRFVVSSGIGMDAGVCQDLQTLKPQTGIGRIFGRINYITTGIKMLIASKPVKGYVLLDGIQKVEFNYIYFVSAHIHPYEGGGFEFAPDADPGDGKLSICIVHCRHKWKVAFVLLGALFGRGKSHYGMRNYTCEEVEVHLERPMEVHADGESCGEQKDIQLHCIPQKIRMIV